VEELEAQLEGEAAERFQPNLLDNIGDAVFITDLEMRIQFWNPAAEELYGWEAREVLGKDASKVLKSRSSSPGDTDQIGATPSTSIWKGELFRRAKNGEWLLVQSKVNTLTNEAGEPVGLVTIHRDVSEQRKMEKALQMSERRFRQIFQAGPLGMMLLDEGGVLVSVNPHFCQMLGYPEMELVGSHHLEITHPEDLEPEATLMRRLLAGATPGYELVKRCIHKEGHVVWVQIHATLLRDDQGRLGHVLGIAEDITQKREAEKQLRSFKAGV
jgi:PAS domain S-box-containing protein